jgi:hypothetical protein
MKKSRQKRKVSAVETRLRGDLEEWHRVHEFDLAQMIEEKPKLFRALLAQPSLFKGSPIGQEYCRLVSSAVTKAEKSTYYKEAFISPRLGIRPKDKLSIGGMVSKKRLEKRR